MSIILETHPLAPFLPPNARVLLLGSFPPPRVRWKMDFYYPNLQNDMWRILGLLFFADKHYFLTADGKNFREAVIHQFLQVQGIAIYDTAKVIRRLQGNASDKYLEVVERIDLNAILKAIPHCLSLITTGEKATDTLLSLLPLGTEKPMIGAKSKTVFADRALTLYRLPSSSRAYPLSLEKKAKVYAQVFTEMGYSVFDR